MESKRNKRGVQFVNFLYHPIPHPMAPRQNPRDKVLATPSSTAASFMSLQRPPAGGEDQKLIRDFELYYMQLKAVKVGDGHSAKEYFRQLGTCLVSVQFFVRICF